MNTVAAASTNYHENLTESSRNSEGVSLFDRGGLLPSLVAITGIRWINWIPWVVAGGKWDSLGDQGPVIGCGAWI